MTSNTAQTHCALFQQREAHNGIADLAEGVEDLGLQVAVRHHVLELHLEEPHCAFIMRMEEGWRGGTDGAVLKDR